MSGTWTGTGVKVTKGSANTFVFDPAIATWSLHAPTRTPPLAVDVARAQLTLMLVGPFMAMTWKSVAPSISVAAVESNK